MTYDQYWFGDPWMVVAYRKKHLLEQQERNTDLWLAGLYVNTAVSVALANGFREKGTPPTAKYPEKPYDIFPKTKEQREAEEREKNEKLAAMLTAWGKRVMAMKEKSAQ